MDNAPDFPPSSASKPSAYTVRPCPTLPWEVIERVIDHSHEHTPTLCSFALTCRQLRPRSSLVLFSDVHIKFRKDLFAFCNVLQTQPRLQLVVRSLAVCLEEFSPFPLLSILTNLRRVTFCGSLDHDDYPKYISLHASTIHCCQALGRSIQSLTFQGVWFRNRAAFVRLIPAFSNLQELACHDVRYRPSRDSDPIEFGIQHRLFQRMRLRTLSVRIILIYLSICQIRPKNIFISSWVLLWMSKSLKPSLFWRNQPLRCCVYRLPRNSVSVLLGFSLFPGSHVLVVASRLKQPELSAWPCLQILVLRVDVDAESLRTAIDILRRSRSTRITNVTVDLFSHAYIAQLLEECRKPITVQLLLELEKCLAEYPIHQASCSLDECYTLNTRRSISWKGEFDGCFLARQPNLPLTSVNFRYCTFPSKTLCR